MTIFVPSSALNHSAETTHLQEHRIVRKLIDQAALSPETRSKVSQSAKNLVRRIRSSSKPGPIEALLAEYGLSNAEGITLMRLAEALLRVPDTQTADALVADKIIPGDWAAHCGRAASTFVNAASLSLLAASRVLNPSNHGAVAQFGALLHRLGAPVIRRAMIRAMTEMGRQFVLGQTIQSALDASKRAQGCNLYSFDMLGEAAINAQDAQRYFEAYRFAIQAISLQTKSCDTKKNPGISVKLSALHPRYEVAQTHRIMAELVPRVTTLVLAAKTAGIGLSIDAEEANRLTLSLSVIDAVLATPELAQWDGFGVVVQAYGPRAGAVIDHLYQLATQYDRKMTLRLVKGAYWDSEIKQAQLDGLNGFPVFTSKAATDISYIAQARKLFGMTDRIYPQFATHNAHTVAAILHMAKDFSEFEFQRLHGMGAALYDAIGESYGMPCRIYAPVGAHKDLLAYLVRRLLENGANSSFVNQIVDPAIPPEQVVMDPISAYCPNLRPLITGIELFQPVRANSKGYDLSDTATLADIDRWRDPFRNSRWNASPLLAGPSNSQATHLRYAPAHNGVVIGSIQDASATNIETALKAARPWAVHASKRAEILLKIADLFEKNAGELFAMLALEAGKTLPDAVSELREAIDFLRYYAVETKNIRGETAPLGIVACISPWNFPLAIFTGQIAAALAAGNAVLAKPAEQTPLIAYIACQLIHRAGVPLSALQLLLGDGAVGASLTCDPRVNGVAFTGSTLTAKVIKKGMAEHLEPGTPLIAETGGLNAMIVDSTALPEQAIKSIMQSAFQSAGQRCSALRCVYVQTDIAVDFIETLVGAMQELSLGDPWHINTDLGPVIDTAAQRAIAIYIAQAREENRLLYSHDTPHAGNFVTPALIQVNSIADLQKEVFGPVLHIATFDNDEIDNVIEAINATGYGLTFGLQSRLTVRMQHISEKIKAGNIYINRNQIGAVVGSQPFGGNGLSGTGPKAGGPFYLARFRSLLPPPPGADLVQESALETAALSFLEVHTMNGAALTKAVMAATTPPHSPVEILPGPTGEMNARSTRAKPPILCAGPGFKAAAAQAACVQDLGGVAIVADGMVSATDIQALCPLGGLIWWGDRTTAQAYERSLAQRDGSIVALITGQPDPAHVLFEHHMCIDTTAAGGNVDLLRDAS